MDKPTRQSKFQELTPSQLTQITGGGWLEGLQKVFNVSKLKLLEW
ncbi:TPA: ComC/BlpC family leader-containing pheromone/bacteriocin [Streptococcus equi subsp. zooepidemicus]|nr:ComC/BlpC family leader-containing pheromone/bacteriocin [Streptococcus equi subsp. zooepidemicus]